MFLKLDTSKTQVTTLAAIQLVMMQASTSLMLRKALSRPGITPQSAPAAMPPSSARIQITIGGMALGFTPGMAICEEGMPSAMNSVAAVPARYCPAAPMLNRPVLKATATERPVRMTGVARKSMLPTLAGLKPKVRLPAALRPVENRPKITRRMPSQALLRPSDGLNRPTIRMTSAPAARPMMMDRRDASTERAPSFCKRDDLLLLMRAPPFPAASRPPCTGPAPRR